MSRHERGALAAYLDWYPLAGHRDGCGQELWEVVQQRDLADRRKGDGHRCPNEDCGHEDVREFTRIRLVCRSCGVAQEFGGEIDREYDVRTVADIGYGSKPTTVAGLQLWPGPPILIDWRQPEPPEDYLVTEPMPAGAAITQADIVGMVVMTRKWLGHKHAKAKYTALAVQKDPGKPWTHRWALPEKFEHSQEGFGALSTAVRWISERVEEAKAAGEQAT